jgi:hypothetical protein
LAEKALSGAEPLDVSDRPAKAVDALVASETLRDLRNDHVAFRHDVLREWAIANLLYSEPTIIERLPLDRAASPVLARGAELASRMVLERAVDVARWQSLVEHLSREGIHGSWRRAVMLALVRSEVAPDLLARVSTILLANGASMLRELIRIVMAVDVEPASKRFEAIGIDPARISATLNVPSGPSWHRLIAWLLNLGDALPIPAIPDVVDLYTAWPLGTLGLDPLTPSLLQSLYNWLTEIETARHAEIFREPFDGELDHHRIELLESDIRTGFVLFCYRTPSLAADYLRSLGQRQHREDIVRSILNFRGSLAQAAPAELAHLTATTLIPKQQTDKRQNRHDIEGPFGFLDDEFLPESPTQGPFFELLTHAPQHGLPLIRRLVDHATSFHSGGRDHGTDAITIPSHDGDRIFPWKRSYIWSRDGSGHYSLTSALMALEAWAHSRIESGEPLEIVIADVLGPPDSPAAYLLPVVDLLLSHWPKSREAAVPFLACPELLCIDRERHLHDTFEYPDIFGLKALQKEPVGLVNVEKLKKRPSRQHSLEELLDQYAVFGPVELRETLNGLLSRAAARLDPPDSQSTLADPAFMVTHALNRLNPENWHEVAVEGSDSKQETAYQYVAPDAERTHLEALQEAVRGEQADSNMQFALGTALENPSRSSTEFAATAVEWAQRATAAPRSAEADDNWMREQAIVTAAMIAMRDGDADLRARHAGWASGVFSRAMQTKEDPVHRFRSGLRFNPIAIAFVGMIYSLKEHSDAEDVRALLQVAARENPAAAHGFGAAALTLASVDERLPRAVLRCAFTASIRPTRERNLSEIKAAARFERYRERQQAAVDAELAWLADERPEPKWPVFPPEVVSRQRGIRIPTVRQQRDTSAPQRSRPDEFADHQAAGLWLAQTHSLADVLTHPWLCEIARTYASWTATANGAGLSIDHEVAHSPREWNDAYFNLLSHCLPKFALPEIEQLVLTSITSLSDESFFDIVALFLRSVDAVFFDDGSLQEPIAISIRAALANRLMKSSGWKARLGRSQSASIERHIGPAIATLFFNDHGFIQPTKCYLLPKAVDRLDAFLPVLKKLVESGPSLFVAIVTLNLLEVSPRSPHLSFMVTAAKVWLESYPNDSDFWVDHGIGRRVCIWIDEVRRQEPSPLDTDTSVRLDVDRLLSALIRLGVADAKRLEEALAS